MIADLTILKKGVILLVIPLLSQLGFIGLVSWMRRESAQALDWTVHTKDVIARVWKPMALMAQAHSAIRGYVITGDPAFVDEYEKAARGADDSVGTLRALVQDNPDQSERGRRIASIVDQLRSWLSEIIKQVRDGDRAEAIARVKSHTGQQIFAQLDEALTAFLNEEQRLDAIRQQAMDRSWRRFDATLAIGTVLAIASTATLAVLFGKGIAERLAVLTENTRRLAVGRELMPWRPGNDEIARLDDVFREMAATLHGAARKERESIDLLRRRSAEIDRVNRELAEKQRENELFVYSVSHDLRSPLVNLQGFSKELGLVGDDLRAILAEGAVPPEVRRRGLELLDGEMAESTRYIQAAVTRMSAIIDALLRLSRAGRVEYRPQVVDLAAIVGRVVEALRATIAERRATIDVGPLDPVWGDPTSVEQVFANLIGNAVQYLDPAQPGRVEVGMVAAPPAPQDSQAEGRRVYYVKDNGLGIPEVYHGKVFTAFQRLHKDVASGEGIGLATVRRLVERHGGRVWFESAVGVGSTFYVALPVVPEPAEAEVAEPELGRSSER
jgi:signal transduction histidine kinase